MGSAVRDTGTGIERLKVPEEVDELVDDIIVVGRFEDEERSVAWLVVVEEPLSIKELLWIAVVSDPVLGGLFGVVDDPAKTGAKVVVVDEATQGKRDTSLKLQELTRWMKWY
jgi:hypothetical protein